MAFVHSFRTAPAICRTRPIVSSHATALRPLATIHHASPNPPRRSWWDTIWAHRILVGSTTTTLGCGMWAFSNFKSLKPKPVDSPSEIIHRLSVAGKDPKTYLQADEETRAQIERDLVEEFFQENFSSDTYRFVRDDGSKPRISYPTGFGKEHLVPESHVTLYRIETRSWDDDNGGKALRDDWKIATFYLLVHAGPECPWETLWERLAEMVEKTRTGELAYPDKSLHIAQRGLAAKTFVFMNIEHLLSKKHQATTSASKNAHL